MAKFSRIPYTFINKWDMTTVLTSPHSMQLASAITGKTAMSLDIRLQNLQASKCIQTSKQLNRQNGQYSPCLHKSAKYA